MGHIHHAVYGWVTPAFSYLVACLGALVALRSTRWALLTEGRSRRNWLLLGTISLGGGIWSMHFVAMLGFAVSGVEIHYNVPLTLVSLLVAIGFVGIGIFTVGHSSNRRSALLIGGVATGLGVAAMHYLGMAAMRLPGRIGYDHVLVGASVGIAVLAATAALWAALNIQGTAAVLAASPVMGVAVCAMHYTGMMAVSVHLSDSERTPPGPVALQFVFPLAVGFGTYVFISALAFAVAPSKQRPVVTGRAAPLPPKPAARRAPDDWPQWPLHGTPRETDLFSPGAGYNGQAGRTGQGAQSGRRRARPAPSAPVSGRIVPAWSGPQPDGQPQH
ncbi:NO-binding membrane sensor protein with MHYT domain [Streptomyces sp. TLI_235]|nr:MHYT domain-containing protein [Streptomyces sp. TLI_235]PBC78265.1 NO-binding membrane sensor protein with MHYT domain [Streptomyces sp. TLI_235]